MILIPAEFWTNFFKAMRFSLMIGRVESHKVEFSFDQLLAGRLVIKVDGLNVRTDWCFASLSRVRTYLFEAGNKESLGVRIEKEKRLLFGGVLPQKYRVYVNELLL